MDDRLMFEYWVNDIKNNNRDGTSRQDVLSRCQIGDKITLKIGDIKTAFTAIEVWTSHGCIGYANADNPSSLIKYLQNKGEIHDARIVDLQTNTRGKITCKFRFERNKMR